MLGQVHRKAVPQILSASEVLRGILNAIRRRVILFTMDCINDHSSSMGFNSTFRFIPDRLSKKVMPVFELQNVLMAGKSNSTENKYSVIGIVVFDS